MRPPARDSDSDTDTALGVDAENFGCTSRAWVAGAPAGNAATGVSTVICHPCTGTSDHKGTTKAAPQPANNSAWRAAAFHRIQRAPANTKAVTAKTSDPLARARTRE